jgi:hypothetical protein
MMGKADKWLESAATSAAWGVDAFIWQTLGRSCKNRSYKRPSEVLSAVDISLLMPFIA